MLNPVLDIIGGQARVLWGKINAARLEGHSAHDFFDYTDRAVHSAVNAAAIPLAGVWWDKENLEGYATFDEANALASARSKRLPTREELEQLRALPQRWDADLKGKWFAEREEDLGDPEKALFLPADGYSIAGTPSDQGSYGSYWGSTQVGVLGGYRLGFNKTSTIVGAGDGAIGFSVRCVQEDAVVRVTAKDRDRWNNADPATSISRNVGIWDNVIPFAGLMWDVNNLPGYHTFDEAQLAAASMGKRLPTPAEFARLCSLPRCWDGGRKGVWVAENTDDFLKHDRSLFLPSVGYVYQDGSVCEVGDDIGYTGGYWSNTKTDGLPWGNFLRVGSAEFIVDAGDRAYRLSVRCVQNPY